MAIGSFRWFLNYVRQGIDRSIYDYKDRVVHEVTCNAETDIERMVTIPASTQVEIWNATRDGLDWTFLGVQVLDESGGVWLDVIKDTKTSGSPTGAAERPCGGFWLSCTSPFLLNSPKVKIHATLATDMGITSTFPTRNTSGSVAEGIISRITVYNDATTAVNVKVFQKG